MAKTILTPRQKHLLTLFAEEKSIQNHFYLSGGTALAEYYLQHRLSEDLDFFSMEEVDPGQIQAIFKKIKPKIGFTRVVFQESFNRNLFFIHFADEIIKTEFTYYPFEQIEKPRMVGVLKVDSLRDIAVNKTNTIFTNPRARDFIDLYCILQKEKWVFHELVDQARLKFDMYVDPLQQAQQLLEVLHKKDYPHMLIPFDYKKCEDFWLTEAKSLKKDIVK